MRRFLCFVLAALMLATLVACGEADKKETVNDETVSITESTPKTETPTVEPTKGNHDVISLDFIQSFDQNPTIDEQPVYEKNGLSVKAKALRYDTVKGPQIILAIRNDSDNDLLVQNNYTAVNGFMMRPELDAKVQKHKKTEAQMSLPYLNLAMANIHSLSDIVFSLRILDSKTYAEMYTTPSVKLKLKNTAAKHTSYNESGQTAYDRDGVKVVLQGIKKDTLFESSCVLMVYMTNDTDKTVCIKNNTLSVNGCDITVSMSVPILPGTRAVDKIELYDQDLDEYGITAIDNVKVSFEIYDYEDWKLLATSKVISAELPSEVESTVPTDNPTDKTK